MSEFIGNEALDIKSQSEAVSVEVDEGQPSDDFDIRLLKSLMYNVVEDVKVQFTLKDKAYDGFSKEVFFPIQECYRHVPPTVTNAKVVYDRISPDSNTYQCLIDFTYAIGEGHESNVDNIVRDYSIDVEVLNYGGNEWCVRDAPLYTVPMHMQESYSSNARYYGGLLLRDQNLHVGRQSYGEILDCVDECRASQDSWNYSGVRLEVDCL